MSENWSPTPRVQKMDAAEPVTDSPLSGSHRQKGPEINNIKVLCRFRPDSEYEEGRGKNIVHFLDDKTVKIEVSNSSDTNKDIPCFTYDRVFRMDSKQTNIYDYSIKETIDEFFKGYNGTVLAYGQTGSGKSYTMIGSSIIDKETKGLIPRISEDIFKKIEMGSSEVEYAVGVSFLEIYMENIRDLLNSSSQEKFTIHEDKVNGIYVKGLSQAFVSSSKEIIVALKQGLKNRAISSTLMNNESSRSHTIFQIKLSQKNIVSGTIKKSQLFLVDLAGSEKVDKTGAVGQNLEEAKKINSSLSTLGLVINALTDGKSNHIPYRDSKLTRILQESLGGNSRTSLIITCSPSSLNELETLSTLRFGSRAKSIKNKAHINTELSMSSLQHKILNLEKTNKENQLYIEKIESELLQWRAGEVPTSNAVLCDSSPKSHTKAILAKLNVGDLGNINSTLINNEEIKRRDQKIEELEEVILNMKMQNLKTSHLEELRLFQLESSLAKLNEKLRDVILVNENLRKHLLISEKIVESRDAQINRLKNGLKEQQYRVLQESLSFESKLSYLKEKLDQYNNLDTNENEKISSDKNTKSFGDFIMEDHNDESMLVKLSSNSPLSPKSGLNLRIVKPVRGGKGRTTVEEDEFF